MIPGIGLIRILAVTVTACAVAATTSTTLAIVASNVKKIIKTVRPDEEAPAPKEVSESGEALDA